MPSFLDRFRDPTLTEAPSTEDADAITVSTLNQRARQLLEGEFNRLWIEGEISSLSQPRSGHSYFTLKDDKAQVRCAFFRQHAHKVSAPLREGQQVRVHAQVSLFEPRGDYQLIVEAVKEAGRGALLAALEQLKEKLTSEGIFANQRDIPYPPQQLAVITSPTGAAFQDILSVVNARWPWLSITLIPVQVQGTQAAGQMVQALELANRVGRYDAILITRGGGSFEDLWCFNDEQLARAIHASAIPVISAVGHETDTTVSDFAADSRAPTPSAAAERLTPDRRDYRRRLAQLAHRLLNAQRAKLDRYQQQVDYLTARLRHPKNQLEQQRLRLDSLMLRLHRAQERRLKQERRVVDQWFQRLTRQSPIRLLRTQQETLTQLYHRLLDTPEAILLRERRTLAQLDERLTRAEQVSLREASTQLGNLIQRLDIASPLSTLKRGYAVLENEHHRIIRNAEEVEIGESINARLGRGRLRLEVTEKNDGDEENLTSRSS